MITYSLGHVQFYDSEMEIQRTGLEINIFVWEPAGD